MSKLLRYRRDELVKLSMREGSRFKQEKEMKSRFVLDI